MEDYEKIKSEIQKLNNVIVVFFNGHLSENRDQYSPNLNASRLASNKSNTVGFVLPLYGLNANQLNQSSFFEFIAGMSKKLNNENIHFFMFFANNAEEEKQAYNKLIFVEKVTKIIRYDKHIHSIEVILLKESRAEKVEIVVNSKNCSYITKCHSSVFEKTILRAIENLKAQILKNKKKY